MDDGGIHHRPLLQRQALLSQVLLCPLVPFHKMVECQDDGGIRDVVFGKINSGKAADGVAIHQPQFRIRGSERRGENPSVESRSMKSAVVLQQLLSLRERLSPRRP